MPGSFRWRGREPAVEWDSELNRKTFASGVIPASPAACEEFPAAVISKTWVLYLICDAVLLMPDDGKL